MILLHRGEALSAQATYRQRALDHPRIEIRFRTVVEEVLGTDKVSGIRTRDLDKGAVSDLEVAAFFPYVGLRPNSSVVEDRLSPDEDGSVSTDGELRTELPGLLAAGAVRRGFPGQAVSAAGDGTTAAIAAHRFLADGSWPSEALASGSASG